MSFRNLRIAGFGDDLHAALMALDPNMARILAAIPADISLDVGHLPLDQALARLRAPTRSATGDDASPVDTKDMIVDAPHGPIPVRVYRSPVAATNGVTLNFHGGGWVLGSIAHDDAHCRLLAAETGSVVVSANYRLAPEHPYPAAFDDCYAVAEWALASRDSLGVPGARLAVTGSSAGGNLAAAVALRARDAGDLPIGLQLLIYPICDCDLATVSYRDNAEGYFLTSRSMAWFWHHYLPDERARAHRYVSPARAESLAGLPPACIITAEFDPLRDEGELYASRLAAAAVPVTLRRFEGLVHGFLKLGPNEPWSREAMSICTTALREAFAN